MRGRSPRMTPAAGTFRAAARVAATVNRRSAAPADRQVVDPVDEVRGEAHDGPVELHAREAAQELAEERVELEAGEVRAEALVRAMAEGQVAIRFAGDVEAERVGEL